MTLLFLNSIGTGEFVLIIFVILMLFGSKGLPDFAKNIGKGMREIKDASNEIRRDIQNSAVEMRRDLNVPNIEDLTRTDELKKVEDLIKIDEEPTKSQSNQTQPDQTAKVEDSPSKSEGSVYSNKS